MQNSKSDAPVAENGVLESINQTSPTDLKVEAPKKKVRKTSVPVTEVVYGGLADTDLRKAVEIEFEMALQDRVLEETKDRKNAVESYVYDMRNKLHDKYYEFVTDSEREQFISRLQEVEDWLYEDGEDETKGVYISKLEELKKQGDPIEERYKEHSVRGSVIDQLVYCIKNFREAAASNDPRYDHIEMEEKQKVLNECMEADVWLREKKQQQDSLPKNATPSLLSADVRRKTEALDSYCRRVMMKPKPAKPAPAETPSPATPPQGGKTQEKDETWHQDTDVVNSSTDQTSDASSEVPSAAAVEPMETDKSDAA